MAASVGMTAYGGDMFEAGTHMIAATPEITLCCEFYQTSYFMNEDILSYPFVVTDGQVVVPTSPGLGILPEPERLRKYAVRGVAA